MPPRWRLQKSRVSNEESRGLPTQPGKTETPRWDDFCFVDDGLPPFMGTQEQDRPKTSSGVSRRDRSKSRTRPQVDLTVPRPMTSEGRPPSALNTSYSPSKVDGGMIGVAFGSPTHPPTGFFGTLNDLAPPSTYEESVFEQTEPMYQIKGRTSKWKKLGSLFKGGRTAADKEEIFEVPFYKVRIEDQSPEHQVDPPVRRPAEAEMEHATRRSPTPPPKNTPRRSIDYRLAQARLEVARLEEAVAEAEKKAVEELKEFSNDTTRPKLDLVIPDIKMDRYSVMFADLKEIPLRSKLLARRSKTLDRLKPIVTEDVRHLDEAATPDTSTLSPRLALPRRATSPSATKTTAGFSLFPTAALTPNHTTRQMLGVPSPRAPLKRAVTSPARLSPRAETFNAERVKPVQPLRSENGVAVISPGDTTASTDREAPWSAEAFMSPTSTITTIDEDILLDTSPINHKQVLLEPSGAMHQPEPMKTQQMQFLASPTLPQETGDTPEATTPVIGDPLQDDYKSGRVASSVFDQAIAEIAAFGVPSLQDEPPLPSPPSAFVPFVLAPDESKLASDYTEKSPPVISKSRLMMMNMPSPITEAPEESPVPSPARLARGSNLAAPPRIPEPHRSAPRVPITAEKQLRREDSCETQDTPLIHNAAAAFSSQISKMVEESPSISPEKPEAQSKRVQQTPSQDVQTASSKYTPLSRSKQGTTENAAKVWGEPFQASQQQKITVGQPPAPSKPTAGEAPPVPTKDSKFVLPLSRFAVKGTAAEVAQKSGLKASTRQQPVRSVTEPLTAMHMNKSYPKSKPSRLAHSASDESLQKEITNPIAQGTATSTFEKLGLERPSVTTVMAIIKPVPAMSSGEVGVARTISLSRKPSQRILVKRTDPARDASPESRREGAQKLQPTPEQATAVSPRPPRSSSRPKGPLNNLKRSESFKRAIDVGMDDDEEGDMRSGELRARAMSPQMRQVTTGLLVNGHKVMKSSVGVIEEA